MQTALQHEVPAAARAGTAAASAALRAALTGPPRPWRVLGSTSGAWWCAVEDEVIVVTADGAAGLPNGVVIVGGDLTDPAGPEVAIGGGRVEAGERQWQVVRWWEPVPPPVPTDRGAMAGRTEGLAALLGSAVPGPLGGAMSCGDPVALLEGARGSMGGGPGLTPEGDDRIAGAVAGYRYAALCVGSSPGLLDLVRRPLLEAATANTTRLSRSLLAHAFAGAVPLPAGRLLLALAGRGDLDPALAATLSIGASSGRALADGIVEGIMAVVAS